MKMKITKAVIKEWLWALASVLITAIYMPLFLYSRNSEEVNFSEVLFPLGILMLIAIGILLIAGVVTRSSSKASLVGILFVLLLENYRYGEKVVLHFIPSAKYWHVLPTFVFIALHICFVICVFGKDEARKTVSTIITIVMGALIIVNLCGAIPNIIAKMSVSVEEDNEIQEMGNGINHDGANIYYFLLDEAAPFNVMEDVYESDMSEFRRFYEENKFLISEDSYNESFYTKVVLTNLLNLDYVADESTSDKELELLRENTALESVLQSNGYLLRGVGSTEWLSIDSLTEGNQVSAETIDGKNFVQIVMGTTFLYPLFEKDYIEDQEMIMDTFEFFLNDEIYKTNSEFKFIYVNCPHQPFLFDENGNDVSAANYDNWEDEKYYLGQYKFVFQKIEMVVKHIIEKDPNSIIVIASDHGPRFNPKMDINSKKVKNVLQLVYYKGNEINEVDGLSGVNTLRGILSKQFDLDLPLVEVQ